MKIEDVDTFTKHYLIAALWSTNDNADPETGGEPMDANYDLDDIAPECVAAAYETCLDFQDANKFDLHLAYRFYRESGKADHPDAGSADACAGHDFWLTSAGHGTGFWDRGMGAVGKRLTEAAQVYRAPDLYVGDDGKIYGM